MNKPRLEDKNGIASVIDKEGNVVKSFSTKDHGKSYLSAAQLYLQQNYDKLMAEEVEQMDEGNKENKKKKNEYVSNIIKKKLSPEVLPSLKYGRRELKKEEVEQMDEVSGPRLGKYIVAAREKEKEEKKKGQEFVQQMKDAGMKGIGAPLRHKGAHFGKASRENMIKLATNKLTNPDFPVSNRVKVPATESVKIDEAYTVKLTKTKRRRDVKDDIDQPIHAVDRHYDIHDENGKKVGEVLHHYNQYGGHFYNGHIHGSNIPYDRQKITDLKQNAQAFINGVEKTKWHSKLLERTAKRQQKQQQKEEVEQVNEKLTKDMSAGKIISDFIHSDDPKFDGKSKDERKRMALGAYYSMHPEKSKNESIENKMYNNIIAKLEEGRGRPPKEGSEAWKRRQSAAAAGGAHVETPHIATQLMKHADYGFKNHTYKFSDGSTHEITPTQRDTVLRKLRSMTGPGKKPEDREKMYDEINTPTGFFHHTGDKPIASKKLHPMSAQKE